MLEDIVVKLLSMTCREMEDMASETGLHFNTINLIRLGKNKNPKLETILAIQKFFNEK